MRAVVVEEPRRWSVSEIADPEPGAGEVLLRVIASGFCGTDGHILSGETPMATYPLVPGHELIGEVVAQGHDANTVTDLPTVGTRVAVNPNIACQACHYCRIGRQNLCQHYAAVGVTLPGGFAEYVAVPAGVCFPIPDSVPDRLAALTEPLSCAVHGWNRLPHHAGDHYLIYGAGTMGLLMAALVQRAGAASVSMVDLNADRLAFARQFGLDHVATSAEQIARADGFEIVIDATGAPAAITDGLGRVRTGGTFLQFGVADPAARVEIAPFDIYNREIDIVGSMAVHNSFGPALDLLAAGLNVGELVSDVVALTQFDEAITKFRRGTGRKVLVATTELDAERSAT